MNFSRRHGLSDQPTIQLESIDDQLRNAAWNGVYLFIFHDVQFGTYSHNETASAKLSKFPEILWIHHFNSLLDEIPFRFDHYVETIKARFFNCRWNEAYDFLEFVIDNYPLENTKEFVDFMNSQLAKFSSGYRIVDNKICAITDEEELKEVEKATQLPDRFGGARIHIKTALELLSRRPDPELRNSIKESISAVESAACAISGKHKATLGDALKAIDEGHGIHPAFKEGLSKIYGYTSDANGIRHKLLEEDNLDVADARYMLISCSAFVNFLVEKSSTR